MSGHLFRLQRRFYSGSWRPVRGINNPNVKQIPVQEFVNSNKTSKQQSIHVCGAVRSPGSRGWRRLHLSGRISDVACGRAFTVIAARVEGTSHTVLGFGTNSHSQLGYQEQRLGFPLEHVSKPASIFLPTNHKIVKVSCGRAHTLCLDSTGQVFSLGDNSFGQCGRPIDSKEFYFGSRKINKIEGLPTNVAHVVCGQDHSMFLTADGNLFACGWSSDGQTGIGHYNNQPSPQQVAGDIRGVKIIKVSCCADTVLALDGDGNVFGWGNAEYAQFRNLTDCDSEQFNTPRQLMLRNHIPGKVVDIAAGGAMCALLNDRGQVFVWGFGILGQGPEVSQSDRPSLIPESLFGNNIYNPEIVVKKIYAGLSRLAAINSQGELFTWGQNRGSALGLFHSRDQYFPMKVNLNLAHIRHVALGVEHTCALTERIID